MNPYLNRTEIISIRILISGKHKRTVNEAPLSNLSDKIRLKSNYFCNFEWQASCFQQVLAMKMIKVAKTSLPKGKLRESLNVRFCSWYLHQRAFWCYVDNQRQSNERLKESTVLLFSDIFIYKKFVNEITQCFITSLYLYDGESVWAKERIWKGRQFR